MTRRNAFARYQRSMALFSRDIVQVPLRGYQVPFTDYILDTVANGRNETIVIEMARQSGKNEASAQVQVAILARMALRGGRIVKCAPTWKPQIINSMTRFETRAQAVSDRLKFLRFKPRFGYTFECGQAGIAFLSAAPGASVVGATASLLLEIDEAQDVATAKFDKDFSPMRASTGAPVAYYGTPWLDTSLLERARLEVESGRSPGRFFRVPWDRVAEEVPAYGRFVEGEIQRLGLEHPLIRTQYLLLPLEGGGRMLKPEQLRLLLGDHDPAERRPEQAPQIVAGLDFAGADEEAAGLASLATMSGRDSVALTIGRVDHVQIAAGVIVPIVRILARYEWVNVPPTSLHTTLYEILWNRWRVDRVHCDGTGIGETATAFLAAALNKSGRERVHGITFDGAWQSHTRLAFQYVAAVNGARLLDYKVPFDPLQVAGQESAPAGDPSRHAWWQRGHARLEARAGQRVRAHVPEAEGHDDLLISEMLMLDAAHQIGQPRTMRSGKVNFYGQ